MRKSNFALRLQPSLLDEARKLAEAEGVALNQLINVAVAEKLSALRTEEYFREKGRRGNRRNLADSRARWKGNPLWTATNFHRSGRRSQAGNWRMEEVPVSAGKRKGPRLNRMLVPSGISAPISTVLHSRE